MDIYCKTIKVVHKDLYKVFWEDGLQPELILFFDGLNWSYIIMLVVVLYGLKHTELLDWFTVLCGKIKVPEKYAYWIAAVVTALVFMLFRSLEGRAVDVTYISGTIRSLFFTVIFESLFVDIPVLLLKGVGKYIDTKSEKGEKEK